MLSKRTSIQRIFFSLAASLFCFAVAAPSYSQSGSGNLNYDVGVSSRRKVAGQWARLVERFSSASPDNDALLRFGNQATEMHLLFGENSLGVIQDPGSSSNFLTADYYPRMMAAYCYWKYADTISKDPKVNRSGKTPEEMYQQAAETLDAVIDVDRFDRYQNPCILALYIDSAMRSSIGDPDLLQHLLMLRDSLQRIYHIRKDAPLYTGNPSPAELRKILPPDKELKVLNIADRGVPLVLAQRILTAESEALADIILKLRQNPVLTIDLGAEGKIASTEENPIPVISGTIRDMSNDKMVPPVYPFPLEIEAVEIGEDGQARSLGTVAPMATGKFRIPLDRMIPGTQAKVQLKWRQTAASELIQFLPVSPLEGQTDAKDAPLATFAYSTRFPAGDPYKYVLNKSDLLTYQTDLTTDFAFLQGQKRKSAAPGITVTSANARYISWKVMDIKGHTYPEKEIVQSFNKGRVLLDLEPLHTEKLPSGDYHLVVRLTDQIDPRTARWTDIPQPNKPDPHYFSADTSGQSVPGFSVASRNAAFLVGIDSYNARPLFNCSNDANKIMEKLTENFGYSRANLTYLFGQRSLLVNGSIREGFYIVSSEGVQPGDIKQERFKKSLYRFRQTVKRLHANHIILFFSGHGHAEGGKDYFSFPDGDIETRRIFQDVGTILENTEGTIIGIYDACRDGEDAASPFSGAFASSSSKLSYVPILACAPGQSSNDNGPPEGEYGLKDEKGNHIEHGFFTYSLLKSMEAYLASPIKGDLRVGPLLANAIPVMSNLNTQAQSINSTIPKGDEKGEEKGDPNNLIGGVTGFKIGQTISTINLFPKPMTILLDKKEAVTSVPNLIFTPRPFVEPEQMAKRTHP